MMFFSGFIVKLYLIWAYPPLPHDIDVNMYADEDNYHRDLPFLHDISLYTIDLYHFLFGTVLIGIVGCFGLFFNLNAGMRLRRRNDFESVILFIVVIVGLYKVFKGVYHKMETYSKRFLTYFEEKILDVEEM